MIEAGDLRPLGVGETLDTAVKLYRDHFLDLVKASAIVLVPVAALNFLVLVSVPSDAGRSSPSFAPTGPLGLLGGGPAAAGGAALVIFVVALVAGALAQAAGLTIVIDAYLGTTTGWRDSLRRAFRRTGALVWVSILFTVGTVIGFVLCVAPWVWLTVSWSVAIPVMLVEDERGTKALRRSFALVRRRFWPVAGVLAPAYLLTTIVTAAFSLLLVPVILSGASDTAQQAANALGSGAATLLTTPFNAAVAAAIYFDLRIRKEGFDIALVAQRLDHEPAPPATRSTATVDPAPWSAPPPTAAPPWHAPAPGPSADPPPPPDA